MTELKNLNALADQLYQEGMEKAKKESEKLLSQTEKKVEEMLINVQKEANEIISRAKKEAEKHQSAIESEIHQKAKQAKQDLKNQVENLITARILNNSTKDLLSEKEFVGQLILSAMETWKDGHDLELSIPEKLKELKKDLEVKIHSFLPGLKILPTDHLESGFKIEDKGKGYILSFTEQDFRALFEPYIKETVSKILFESDQ